MMTWVKFATLLISLVLLSCSPSISSGEQLAFESKYRHLLLLEDQMVSLGSIENPRMNLIDDWVENHRIEFDAPDVVAAAISPVKGMTIGIYHKEKLSGLKGVFSSPDKTNSAILSKGTATINGVKVSVYYYQRFHESPSGKDLVSNLVTIIE